MVGIGLAPEDLLKQDGLYPYEIRKKEDQLNTRKDLSSLEVSEAI